MDCDQLVTLDNCCAPSTCGQPATWRLLAVEIPAAVLAAWALRRTRG